MPLAALADVEVTDIQARMIAQAMLSLIEDLCSVGEQEGFAAARARARRRMSRPLLKFGDGPG